MEKNEKKDKIYYCKWIINNYLVNYIQGNTYNII